MIDILFNSYLNYHRQNVSIDSYRYLKQLYPNIIRLWNIQFEDEEQEFVNYYPDIPVIFKLSNSLEIVEGATKKLPFMNEIFDIGLSLEGDGFYYINSDCILMPNTIQYILSNEPKAWACSRLDIEYIDSFDNILQQQVVPRRMEAAGQDGFWFNKEWAIENKQYFRHPFLMGQPLFDVIWAGYGKVFGGNTPLGNEFPPNIFHINHENQWATNNSSEKQWNLKIAKSDPLNVLMCNVMVFNLTQNLMRRTPYLTFLNPKPEEKMIERVFFDCMNINRNLL